MDFVLYMLDPEKDIKSYIGLWFADICGGSLISILYSLMIPFHIHKYMKVKNEIERLEDEARRVENERIAALSNWEREYAKLREQLLRELDAKREELSRLEEEFSRDLRQTALEIDSALNAIFQARMDFPLLRSILESRGLIIEKIACPNCGGNIELPESGHVVKCPYCNQNIYAVDVLKEIIGTYTRRSGTRSQ